MCMERFLKKMLPTGRFANVPVKRSLAMAAIKGKNTRSTEIVFRMALVRARIKGWVSNAALPGKPDIYFVSDRLAVFLDGCFWHGCAKCGHVPKTRSRFWAAKLARNKWRDKKNARLLRKRGIKVIRIWEHSLTTSEKIQKLLRKFEKV